MSTFEWCLVVLSSTGLVIASATAWLYRPRRPIESTSVFGMDKVQYEREAHDQEQQIRELRAELARARTLIDTVTTHWVDGSEQWAVDRLHLATVSARLATANRRLKWNRTRVRHLTAADNVTQLFGRREQGIA